MSEIERAKQAEKANADAIDTEQRRASAKEIELQENIAYEVQRATTAERKIGANAAQTDSFNAVAKEGEVELHYKSLEYESCHFAIPAATKTTAGVMTAGDKVTLDNAVKDITTEIERAKRAENDIKSRTVDADTMGYGTTADDMSLEFETLGGENSGSVTFPSATTEKAGVMSAEDKVALDTATSRALRALFVAAGAEYNDSGADKTKTAPWGETVTHKAEHYYLNGLGDITEEQMVKIYNRGNFNDADIAPLSDSFSHANNIRTNLPRVGKWNGDLQSNLCVSNKRIEVLTLHVAKFSLSENCNITFSSTASLFEDSSALSVIDTRCRLVSSSWSGSSFKNCVSLKEVRIGKLENNIVFAQSSQLSKASVLFAIERAIPTAPISITLHPDAYSRLAEDANIVAALEAQPLVTLVSA